MRLLRKWANDRLLRCCRPPNKPCRCLSLTHLSYACRLPLISLLFYLETFSDTGMGTRVPRISLASLAAPLSSSLGTWNGGARAGGRVTAYTTETDHYASPSVPAATRHGKSSKSVAFPCLSACRFLPVSLSPSQLHLDKSELSVTTLHHRMDGVEDDGATLTRSALRHRPTFPSTEDETIIGPFASIHLSQIFSTLMFNFSRFFAVFGDLMTTPVLFKNTATKLWLPISN